MLLVAVKALLLAAVLAVFMYLLLNQFMVGNGKLMAVHVS